MRWVLLFLPMLALAHSDPKIGQTYHNEINNVKNTLNNTLKRQDFTHFKAEDYCHSPNCAQHIHHPKEQQYQTKGATLKALAQQKMATDPNAQIIQKGVNHRPKYTINPNEDMFRHAKRYIENSYEISHGLSNKYTQCKTGQLCQEQNSTKTCQKPTGKPLVCHLTPYPIDVRLINHTQVLPVNGAFGSLTLPNEMAVTQIDLPALRRTPQNLPGGCENNTRPMGVDVFINGQKAKHVTGSFDFHDRGYSCDISMAIPASVLHFAQPKNMHSLRVDFSSQPGDTMIGHGRIVVHSQEKKAKMGWKNSCTQVPTSCQNKQERCTQGGGVRWINGVAVKLNCWEKEQVFQCHYDNTCAPLLATGHKTACHETQSRCSVSLFGQCLAKTATLQCTTKTCEATNLSCGERFFCLDGDCYNEKKEQNKNFNQSASALAAIGAAGQSFKMSKVEVFKGKPAFCTKKAAGFANCCADSGWGKKVGLAKCSAQEKGLAQAKEKGLTIALGQYCAEKVLGVCIRKKKSYCQFNSKMARIIQQQKPKQLHLSFGSAKHPNCQGFTPKQLAQLDFSHIDFAEFYQDLRHNMQLPNPKIIQQRIERKYRDLGGKQ